MPDFNFNFDLSAVATGAVKVLIILAITFIVIWVLRRVIHKAITIRIPRIREESPEQLASRSLTLANVITRFLSFAIWIMSFVMILSVMGVNIAPILAGVGLAGLAIGFAAQNIVRDYFNGFFIVMEDWYRVGEVATASGITGIVEAMGLRRTVLRDLNGTMHVIPNSNIVQGSNWTRDWSRINLDISVAYKEDLDRVISVINEVCKELKEDTVWGCDLLTTPEVLRVNNLGDSGIEIKILGDTKPIKQWALMGELRKRLKARFDQEGIEIPWPHSKVYFGNMYEKSEAAN